MSCSLVLTAIIFVPMKSYVVLFVTAIMLVRPLWPIAEYIVNYDYIVNTLCENKDRPELECNGKCYLSRQLAKEAEQNEKNPFGERAFTELVQVVYFEPLCELAIAIPLYTDGEDNFNTFPNLLQTLFTTDISQPPKLV